MWEIPSVDARPSSCSSPSSCLVCPCLTCLHNPGIKRPGWSRCKSLRYYNFCCPAGLCWLWRLCSVQVLLFFLWCCEPWYKHLLIQCVKLSFQPDLSNNRPPNCMANWATKLMAASSYSRRELQQGVQWAAVIGYSGNTLPPIMFTHCTFNGRKWRLKYLEPSRLRPHNALSVFIVGKVVL